jgi:hypothetical protein
LAAVADNDNIQRYVFAPLLTIRNDTNAATRWPCFMGIDIASRRELIAAGHTEREIGEMLDADSLGYISLSGLRRAMGQPDSNGFCFACFTGSYPVDVPAQLEMDKLALEAGQGIDRRLDVAHRRRLYVGGVDRSERP